jgi:hypothetical protein
MTKEFTRLFSSALRPLFVSKGVNGGGPKQKYSHIGKCLGFLKFQFDGEQAVRPAHNAPLDTRLDRGYFYWLHSFVWYTAEAPGLHITVP